MIGFVSVTRGDVDLEAGVVAGMGVVVVMLALPVQTALRLTCAMSLVARRATI